MREIKFRAWHQFEEHKILDQGEIVTEESSGLNSADILDRFDTVMQYTGLKDKNGKDIYEGDILEDQGFLFRVEYVGGWFVGQPSLKNEVPGYLHFESFMGYEVAGNIHENPELLEVKTEVAAKTNLSPDQIAFVEQGESIVSPYRVGESEEDFRKRVNLSRLSPEFIKTVDAMRRIAEIDGLINAEEE